MSCTPKPTSLIARAISLLDVRGALSTAELAEELGIVPGSVHANMGNAIKHGLMHFTRQGNGGLWALGLADDAPGNEAIREAAEQEPFSCALYNDGDLVLINAGMDGDQAITLPKAQARVLVSYLMSFAHEEAAG